MKHEVWIDKDHGFNDVDGNHGLIDGDHGLDIDGFPGI